eukprot:g5700.t1
MVLSQDDDELQRDPEEVTEVGVGKITALWKKLSSAQASITFDESDEYLSDDAFLKKRAKDLDKPATSSDLKVMAALEQELKKQIADPLFLQEGGLLMFPCQATYSSAGLFPRAKVMTAAQKKAKDDEFRNRLMKTTAHGSSAAPLLAAAAAPPAMKKATTKSAREVLEKKQIEKLKSAERLVALAAEKAGLSMKLRIYETDDNDDPFGDEPLFEHAILSTFPPKLPKSMSKNDFFCRMGTYEPGDKDLYLGTFDSGKMKNTEHWIAEFEHGAEERFTTEFKKEKKMEKMKSKKGGLGGAFGFGDWSDDSFSDDDSDFGLGGGGMFGFGGGMSDESELDFVVLIYRTALMVIVPAAEKRTTGVSSSSSGGRGAENDAGAAPKKNAGSKASPVGAKAKAKAAGAAPKAKAQSKAAKAGAPKAKAKPAKAKAKAVPKQAAAKMKTVTKK